MKKTLIGLGIITALFPAVASAGNGYIGGSFGQVTYDEFFTSEDEEFASAVGIDLEDSDTGFKIFGGYRTNDYLAFEVFYANLGEVSISQGSGEIALEHDTLGASLVGLIPITDNFELFGKFGFHSWGSEVNFSGGVSAEAEDGNDTMFGVGAAYKLDKVSIRAEFERYTLDDQDADFMSIGFAYHF